MKTILSITLVLFSFNSFAFFGNCQDFSFDGQNLEVKKEVSLTSNFGDELVLEEGTYSRVDVEDMIGGCNEGSSLRVISEDNRKTAQVRVACYRDSLPTTYFSSQVSACK